MLVSISTDRISSIICNNLKITNTKVSKPPNTKVNNIPDKTDWQILELSDKIQNNYV